MSKGTPFVPPADTNEHLSFLSPFRGDSLAFFFFLEEPGFGVVPFDSTIPGGVALSPLSPASSYHLCRDPQGFRQQVAVSFLFLLGLTLCKPP